MNSSKQQVTGMDLGTDVIESPFAKDLNGQAKTEQEQDTQIALLKSEVDKYKGLVLNVTKDMEEKVSQHIEDMWRQIEPQLAQMGIRNQLAHVLACCLGKHVVPHRV